MWTPNPYYEKYLAHYGTKGMKWGVINKDDDVIRMPFKKGLEENRRAAEGRYSQHYQSKRNAADVGNRLRASNRAASADYARRHDPHASSDAARAAAERMQSMNYGQGRGRMPSGGMDESAEFQKKQNDEKRRLESRKDQMVEYLEKHKGSGVSARENEYLIKLLNDAKSLDDMRMALSIAGNILNGNISGENTSRSFIN